MVKALGFDFSIDEEYQPYDTEGFLPCKLNGQSTGFELYFNDAASMLAGFPQLEAVVGPRDCALLFSWGGNWLEFACIQLTTAALLKNCNAVIHNQDDDIFYTSVEELLTSAQEAIQYAKAEARETQAAASPPKKPWWKLW